MTEQMSPPANGWRLPPLPLSIMAVAFVLGVAAILWFERGVVFDQSASAIVMEFDEGAERPTTTMETGVTWAYDETAPGGGAVIASINNGERRETLRVTIRPNTDTSFDASHVIEISTPNQYPERKISAVTGVFLKENASAPGRPLIGTSVQVADDLHWFVLSAERGDRQANLSQLLAQDTFQINVSYENGMRGIIGFEKGDSGRRIVEQAVAAWSRESQ